MDDAEYLEFRDGLFDAMWKRLAPLEQQIEETEQLPYDVLLPALREMRAFALLIPTRYGGLGLTVSQYLPIISEFAKIHGGIRAFVHVHNSFCHALADLGTEAQQDLVLPAAARGENSVAFALTEPDHGTGLDLGTTALRDGDDYVVNGRKWLITNSDIASHFILVAKTPESAHGALSAFLIERGTPGLVIESMPELMGCKGGQHGQLTFNDARISSQSLLGGAEGRGEQQFEKLLEISRLLVAASSLGTAEYALDLSLAHAKRRVTFGKPIAARQAVQRYLVEMATDVYALRQMLRDAAAKWDAGQRIPAESSMCKLFGLEAVGRVTDRALLVHGGIGYTRAHPIERLYRDARLNWLEEGTPTIQVLTAVRELLKDGWAWRDAPPSETSWAPFERKETVDA